MFSFDRWYQSMRYISGADGALQASAKGSNDSSHWSLNNGQLCIAMDT